MVPSEEPGAPGYPWLDPTRESPELLVSLRFGDDDVPALIGRLRDAVAVLADAAGFIEAAIGRSTDDPRLVLLSMRWASVGAYRRALSPVPVRMVVVPVLSEAIDESSAFEVLVHRDESGTVESSGSLAADAAEIGLGNAAGPWIAPAPS